MIGYISEEQLRNAEQTAISRDIRLSEAIAEISSGSGDIELLNPRSILKLVRKRPENSHKGDFGRLVLIAGSERFPGAAQIAALAALRSGVGLCEVITTKTAAFGIAAGAREATLYTVDADSDGFMSPSESQLEGAREEISRADAVLIGCGLGTGAGCLKMLKTAVKCAECPIIFDADGINLVSGRIELVRKAKAETVVTPHPAELSRLCGVSVKEVLEHRPKYAREISEKTGAVTVSKSAGTLIVSKGRTSLSARGNSGLAKGGSGDFLAGLIASLLAQGYPAEEAAKIGVTVQGLACEYVTKENSERSVTVSDMIDCLPVLFKKIERLI